MQAAKTCPHCLGLAEDESDEACAVLRVGELEERGQRGRVWGWTTGLAKGHSGNIVRLEGNIAPPAKTKPQPTLALRIPNRQ